MRYLTPFIAAFVVALSAAAVPAAETAESEMEKTVVTATRTEVSLKDAPGAVTVISAEDIKDLTANDVLDIVRDTAGVSLSGRGVGGRSVISIRGLESRQTLILVDGKRVTASDAVFGHSDFEHNWVPIETIERIEVVRGPLSALYGSEAMGGVINIITKKTASEWHGSARIGGGVRADNNGGENQTYGAQVSGPLVAERLKLGLSAEYMKDENTPDKDDPDIDEIEAKEVTTYGARLAYTPSEDHTFEADVTMTTDDRERLTSSSGRDYLDDYDLEKIMYGLSWSGDVGPTRSAIKAYRSDIDKLSVKRYTDGSTTEYPERLINDAVDAQTSFFLGDTIVTLGGEWRNEELESTSLTSGKDSVVHQALFAQGEVPLFGDRLLLTPGVRLDDHETFASEVSPRIYAVYKLTDMINLKAGYGHAFRAPTVKQVSEDYEARNGPHIFLGNPDLEPETSDAYEVGAEYYGAKVFARALYFYNDVDNLIAYERIGSGPPPRTYLATNIDKARTYGVETELGLNLPMGLDLTAGYTYLEAEDTENEVRLEGKPRHEINAKLKYKNQSLGLSAVLRAQHIADQVFENDDDVLEEVPAYTLWHFSVSKQFLQHFEVQVGIDNIADVRLADETDLYDYEERGRFYYANLRYSF
jgi:outer membrane receptor for ferrienterochelin and colicins